MENNNYEQLREWHSLLKNGTLTQEDFDKIKAEILQKENRPEKTKPNLPNEKAIENDIAHENQSAIFATQSKVPEEVNGNNSGKRSQIATILWTIVFVCILALIGIGIFLWFQKNNAGVNATTTYTDSIEQQTIQTIQDASQAAQQTSPQAANSNTQSDAASLTNNSTDINSDQLDMNIIKQFMSAEDNRDMAAITGFLSPDIYKYYDLSSPTINQIENRYNHLWSITYNNHQDITNIEKIGSNKFIVYFVFTYYGRKTGKQFTYSNYTTIYEFDGNNKVIAVYDKYQ